jgi:hypothetical protein
LWIWNSGLVYPRQPAALPCTTRLEGAYNMRFCFYCYCMYQICNLPLLRQPIFDSGHLCCVTTISLHIHHAQPCFLIWHNFYVFLG